MLAAQEQTIHVHIPLSSRILCSVISQACLHDKMYMSSQMTAIEKKIMKRTFLVVMMDDGRFHLSQSELSIVSSLSDKASEPGNDW